MKIGLPAGVPFIINDRIGADLFIIGVTRITIEKSVYEYLPTSKVGTQEFLVRRKRHPPERYFVRWK